MSKKIVKNVIKNEEGWIIAIIYEDDYNNIKCKPNYNEKKILIEVDIIFNTDYVGSIMCYNGNIEKTTLELTEEGNYKEV